MDHQKTSRAPAGTGDAASQIDPAVKQIERDYRAAAERTLEPAPPQLRSITQLGENASRWRVRFADMPDNPVIVETGELLNARRLERAVFAQHNVALPLGKSRKWHEYLASVHRVVRTAHETPAPAPAWRALGRVRSRKGGGR